MICGICGNYATQLTWDICEVPPLSKWREWEAESDVYARCDRHMRVPRVRMIDYKGELRTESGGYDLFQGGEANNETIKA